MLPNIPQRREQRRTVEGLKSNALSAWPCTTGSWVELTTVTSWEAATMYDESAWRITNTFFCFMFDVAVINAFILHAYDVLSGTALDHKHFRLKLAEQLIGNYHTRKCAGYPRKRSRPLSSSSIPTDHFPTHSNESRCVYCRDFRSPSRRKHSVWACTAFDIQPCVWQGQTTVKTVTDYGTKP